MSHRGGFSEGEIKGLRQCYSLKKKKKKAMLRGIRENSQSGSNFTSSPAVVRGSAPRTAPSSSQARKTEQSCRRLDNTRWFPLTAEDWTGET